MSLPILLPPAPFNLDEVVKCGRAVCAAYDIYEQWKTQGNPRSEEDFEWETPESAPGIKFSAPIWSHQKGLFHLLNKSEPLAFVAHNNAGDVWVVFRGTNSTRDWIDDLDCDLHEIEIAPNFGKVHDGFRKAYATMRESLLESLKALGPINRLFITGHSLGGGFSTVAVPDILHNSGLDFTKTVGKHYNFASPRVSDQVFADAANSCAIPTYRIVNTCDLVPTVPPSIFLKSHFVDVGTPVCFTAQYGSISGNHSMSDAYLVAMENSADENK